MTEQAEKYRVPVNAFGGGIGYRYVLGSCAKFPWNDFSRSDTREEIAFEVEPADGWGGDEMGVRIIKALDEFANDGKRTNGGKCAVSFEKKDCRHGSEFSFSAGNVRLFTLEPRNNWKGDDLAAYIAESLSELIK